MHMYFHVQGYIQGTKMTQLISYELTDKESNWYDDIIYLMITHIKVSVKRRPVH